MAKLTGKAIVPRPVLVAARQPRLLAAIAAMESAESAMHSAPARAKMLAQMQVARLAGCRYCIDIGSAIALRAGVEEEEMLALPDYESHPGFDALDRAVLAYATRMSVTPATVTAETLETMARYFDDAQIVELTAAIAWENHRVRFNQALDIVPDQFSALAEPAYR
ncbi:MAG: carboxymuconolactone decarboxylase family protein [Bryobacteraceae bacterium]